LPGIVRKKRTEIAIEIDEVVFVKGFSNPFGMAWCVGCANEVLMVTPAQAAVIARVSVRDILTVASKREKFISWKHLRAPCLCA
jgi:hypothetical protein